MRTRVVYYHGPGSYLLDVEYVGHVGGADYEGCVVDYRRHPRPGARAGYAHGSPEAQLIDQLSPDRFEVSGLAVHVAEIYLRGMRQGSQ